MKKKVPEFNARVKKANESVKKINEITTIKAKNQDEYEQILKKMENMNRKIEGLTKMMTWAIGEIVYLKFKDGKSLPKLDNEEDNGEEDASEEYYSDNEISSEYELDKDDDKDKYDKRNVENLRKICLMESHYTILV